MPPENISNESSNVKKSPLDNLKDDFYDAKDHMYAAIVGISHLNREANKLIATKEIPGNEEIKAVFDQAERFLKIDARYRDNPAEHRDLATNRAAAQQWAQRARDLQNLILGKTTEIVREKISEKDRENKAAEAMKEQREAQQVQALIGKENDLQEIDAKLGGALTMARNEIYRKYGEFGQYCQQIDSFVDKPDVKLPTVAALMDAFEDVEDRYRAVFKDDFSQLKSALNNLYDVYQQYRERLMEMIKIQPIRLKRLGRIRK